MAKLNDCEAEAAETQVWLKFAVKCQYLTVEQGRELYGTYNQVLSGLVKMITHPDDWLLDAPPHTSHTSHTSHTPSQGLLYLDISIPVAL